MSGEDRGRPFETSDVSEVTIDELRESAASQRVVREAMGYDWGGYDLTSPWDTGHQIKAVTDPPRAITGRVSTRAARDPRALLPDVDALCTRARVTAHGEARVRRLAERTLEAAHQRLRDGVATDRATVERTLDRRLSARLRPVINATGALLPPELGRAPWSDAALDAARRAAAYCDVDFDLDAGRRGGRGAGVEERLCALTGAEAALVLNNAAAATTLLLAAVAGGRAVLVSRGELVEFAGGDRVPDLLTAAGVRLRAVGTTNRTTAADYLAPLDDDLRAAATPGAQPGPGVAAILRVDDGEFCQIGFTARPPLRALAGRGVPLLVDLRAGALAPDPTGAPSVADALTAGADALSFAGDLLLGGPQSGLVVGRATIIEQMRRHPLHRALEVGKTTLAALEATLDAHLRGQPTPVDRMRSAPLGELRAAANRWKTALGGEVGCRVLDIEAPPSNPGGGAPSVALAIHDPDPRLLAPALAEGDPPVVGRSEDGALWLDARTVVPLGLEGALLDALTAALRAVRAQDPG